MNLQDAIQDPNRPISISPHDWMKKTVQNLEDNETMAKQEQNNILIASKNDKTTNDEDGVATLDNALDMIVQGVNMAYEGLALTKRADLKQSYRKVLDNIQDLLDNAVGPYTSDIIEQLDLLEGDDESK